MDREAALEWAATVRRVRAEVLAGVEAGDLSLAAVLERAQEDPLVGMIHVLDVVEALPGWGKVVCRRTLDGLGIGHHTSVAEVDAGTLQRAFAQVPA
jgi:hypothetical protein